MSETPERVRGIKRLPIFPLPLVLFPNELLPLHIFEPKYRKMFAYIEAGNNLFGISWQPEDGPVTQMPQPGSIGCAAEVREKETLEDGRSNVLTLGVARYVLLDYIDSDAPYAVGDVEFFVDDPGDEDERASAAQKVFEKFRRMAAAAFKLAGNRGTPPELASADPEPLSFLVGAAMNLDAAAKYDMLTMRSTYDRLIRIDETLADIVQRIESQAEIASVSKTNGHGGRMPDL
ncbi:MAG: LON peptidase substrate-binding domain-containing protein [Acidobacteriota bacterium]|nr:MAG: LON peptidase substrate-binding domain-containing protein [Acidobacteriota bacterium]